MFISEFIQNEKWNGGNWIETFCEYGSYSIIRNPGTRTNHLQFKELLILVIDDPKGDGEPFYRMIPDSEVKDLDAINRFVERLYEEYGIPDCTLVQEYKDGFSLRKFNNNCWQVQYKDEVVGEYDSADIARKNIAYRIKVDWGKRIGDTLLEERRKLSEKCAEISDVLRNGCHWESR